MAKSTKDVGMEMRVMVDNDRNQEEYHAYVFLKMLIKYNSLHATGHAPAKLAKFAWECSSEFQKNIRERTPLTHKYVLEQMENEQYRADQVVHACGHTNADHASNDEADPDDPGVH